MQMKQIKKEYHDDLKTLKNMCKSKIHNKENINVETRKLKGPSSYSTL